MNTVIARIVGNDNKPCNNPGISTTVGTATVTITSNATTSSSADPSEAKELASVSTSTIASSSMSPIENQTIGMGTNLNTETNANSVVVNNTTNTSTNINNTNTNYPLSSSIIQSKSSQNDPTATATITGTSTSTTNPVAYTNANLNVASHDMNQMSTIHNYHYPKYHAAQQMNHYATTMSRKANIPIAPIPAYTQNQQQHNHPFLSQAQAWNNYPTFVPPINPYYTMGIGARQTIQQLQSPPLAPRPPNITPYTQIVQSKNTQQLKSGGEGRAGLRYTLHHPNRSPHQVIDLTSSPDTSPDTSPDKIIQNQYHPSLNNGDSKNGSISTQLTKHYHDENQRHLSNIAFNKVQVQNNGLKQYNNNNSCYNNQSQATNTMNVTTKTSTISPSKPIQPFGSNDNEISGPGTPATPDTPNIETVTRLASEHCVRSTFRKMERRVKSSLSSSSSSSSSSIGNNTVHKIASANFLSPTLPILQEIARNVEIVRMLILSKETSNSKRNYRKRKAAAATSTSTHNITDYRYLFMNELWPGVSVGGAAIQCIHCKASKRHIIYALPEIGNFMEEIGLHHLSQCPNAPTKLKDFITLHKSTLLDQRFKLEVTLLSQHISQIMKEESLKGIPMIHSVVVNDDNVDDDSKVNDNVNHNGQSRKCHNNRRKRKIQSFVYDLEELPDMSTCRDVNQGGTSTKKRKSMIYDLEEICSPF